MTATLVYFSAHARRRQSLPLRMKLQDVKVWPAGNVLDTIQLVRQHAPDLLLLDLGAPEGEQAVFLRKLMLQVDVRSVPWVGILPTEVQPQMDSFQEFGMKQIVVDDGRDEALANVLRGIIQERSLNCPHIFLMEDDPVLAEVLMMALQLSGFRVTHTSQGSEALRLLRTATFDAIITDIHVKEFSGFQLIEFLAQQGVRTPVVVITGAFPQGFHQLARRLNIAEYFEKPLDIDVFSKRLNALIQERRKVAS